MTMLPKKNIFKICVSVLMPLFFVVVQYFSLLAIKYFGFHSLVSFLIVGSFNLFVIFLACKKFDIRLNQSNVLLQLKSGFIISGFGLMSLMFAYFILKISSDISIWELFRGEERSGLSVSYRVLYLFTIALLLHFMKRFIFELLL